MEMSENQHMAPKDYYPVTENGWRETHPFGIDYRGDLSKPDTHDLIVRLDGTANDLIDSKGTWDKHASKRRTDRTLFCRIRTARWKTPVQSDPGPGT